MKRTRNWVQWSKNWSSTKAAISISKIVSLVLSLHHDHNIKHAPLDIAQKGAESDYQAAMGDVIKLIDNCNGQIVKIITLASAR